MQTMTQEAAIGFEFDNAGVPPLAVDVRLLDDAEIDAVAGGPIPIALGALALASLGGAAVFGYQQGYAEGKDRAERDNAQDAN